MEKRIRMLRPADVPAALAIYAPYVAGSSISFEYQPPSLEEFTRRAKRVTERYPWLVCEIDGKVAGYAYAGAVRTREAYQWAAELSVYLDREQRGRGIGTLLYSALLDLLRAQGYTQVYGCVTQPNPASDRLHRSMAFETVGVWKQAGYKLGEWHDVAWYEKFLRPREQNPTAPVSWQELPAGLVEEICARYSGMPE